MAKFARTSWPPSATPGHPTSRKTRRLYQATKLAKFRRGKLKDLLPPMNIHRRKRVAAGGRPTKIGWESRRRAIAGQARRAAPPDALRRFPCEPGCKNSCGAANRKEVSARRFKRAQIIPLLSLGCMALSMLFGCLATIFWVWMLVDCLMKEPSYGNDKIIWALVILLTHGLGALLYYFIRRPERIRQYGQ